MSCHIPKPVLFSRKLLVSVCLGGVVALAGCFPDSAQSYVQRAKESAAAGDVYGAARFAEKAVELGFDHPKIKTLHAVYRYQSGETERSLAILKPVAREQNGNFQVQYFYGWFLSEEGRYAEALEPLRKAHGLVPDDADNLALLVRCTLEQNLLHEGRKYIAALRRLPSYKEEAVLDNALGILAVGHGRYEEAGRHFQKALQQQPGNVAILQNLAVLHDRYMRQPRLARRYYMYCIAQAQQIGNDRKAAELQQRLRQLAR